MKTKIPKHGVYAFHFLTLFFVPVQAAVGFYFLMKCFFHLRDFLNTEQGGNQ